MWYGGADWDFNGDGVVDERDEEAERQLRLWTQEEDGGAWRSMRTRHSRRGKWFRAKLYHFTGYEVST
jgi:predicted RecB family nuclease